MAKAGRPRIEIDSEQVRKLAQMHCTTREIAAFFDVSVDTIDRNYAEQINKGRQQGKIRLRDQQLKCAEKGNVAMLIFLGKQYLGQSDKVEQDIKTESIDSEKSDIIDKLVALAVKNKK